MSSTSSVRQPVSMFCFARFLPSTITSMNATRYMRPYQRMANGPSVSPATWNGPKPSAMGSNPGCVMIMCACVRAFVARAVRDADLDGGALLRQRPIYHTRAPHVVQRRRNEGHAHARCDKTHDRLHLDCLLADPRRDPRALAAADDGVVERGARLAREQQERFSRKCCKRNACRPAPLRRHAFRLQHLRENRSCC